MSSLIENWRLQHRKCSFFWSRLHLFGFKYWHVFNVCMPLRFWENCPLWRAYLFKRFCWTTNYTPFKLTASSPLKNCLKIRKGSFEAKAIPRFGGNSNILSLFTPNLGEMIWLKLFKWVGSATNQPIHFSEGFFLPSIAAEVGAQKRPPPNLSTCSWMWNSWSSKWKAILVDAQQHLTFLSP